MADKVEISAVHLSTIGDHVHVALEINGRWVEVIRERKDNAYSHIVEASGIEQACIEGKPTRATIVAATDARDRRGPMIRKGGRNVEPSQVTERPPPPAPMNKR